MPILIPILILILILILQHLGSIAEVSAGIDLADSFRLIDSNKRDRIKELLRSSYSMIRKLP
jgi:hypothetical protein